MAEIFDWDVIAGNNNDAPPNGFPEGMTPSSLNNAMREVMAVIARFNEVISGEIITAGTGDAYTIAVTQSVTSYVVGNYFTFTANRDNEGGAATINVNGAGNADLKLPGSVDPIAGVIKSGGVYTITYTGAEFIIHSVNAAPPPNTLYFPYNFDASGDDQTSADWTKPAGLKRIRISATTGGGGGEAASATTGGGGAGSPTVVASFNAEDLNATEAMLISRGGAAGIAFGIFATSSLVTSFGGTLISIPGSDHGGDGTEGTRDDFGAATSSGSITIDGSAVSSLIHPSASGQNGVPSNSGSVISGALGGASIYAGMGWVIAAGLGADSVGFGSGGPGGSPTQAGRAGAGGLIIIEEFF